MLHIEVATKVLSSIHLNWATVSSQVNCVVITSICSRIFFTFEFLCHCILKLPNLNMEFVPLFERYRVMSISTYDVLFTKLKVLLKAELSKALIACYLVSSFKSLCHNTGFFRGGSFYNWNFVFLFIFLVL